MYSSHEKDENGRESADSDEEVVKIKRTKNEPEERSVEEKLETLITSLGNKAMHSLESNLEGLAAVLESDLNTYKTKILNVLLQCATEKIERITIFTTLIGLLNAKNHSIVEEFLEMLVRKVKSYLKKCQWDQILHCIRFLSDLVNCNVVSAASVIALYENFVEVTLEEHIPQVRSDFFVYVILHSVSWVGRTLAMRKGNELNKILSSISQYLSRRHTPYLSSMRVFSTDDQEDYLDCLWAQVQSLRNQDWNEKCIIRPYQAFSSVLEEALPHTLPHITVPSHETDTAYPLPQVVFRLFDYTDVPEGSHASLPGSHSIERYLIEDHLSTLMDVTYYERKDCAVALLNAKFRAKVPLSYIIAETALGKLFKLPDTDYLELFYSVLFIELCKEDHEVMPQVLAQATGKLFEKLDTMNAVCVDRFARWFAYHLSQFKFQWCWDDWVDCLSEPAYCARQTFIRETIYYLIRFSYHQHICDLLPKVYASLLPPPPDSLNKYESPESDSLPGVEFARKLLDAIKSRCSPDDAMEILKDLSNPLTPVDATDAKPLEYNPLQIDVFFTILLNLGNKSFSHSFAALAKFHVLCKALVPIDCLPAQVELLAVMFQVWKNHDQMMIVLVDKMIKVQLIKCQAAIEWVFSSAMRPEIVRFYVWNIICSTVSKMCKHYNKLNEELVETREKYDQYQQKVRDGMEVDVDDDMPTQDEIERKATRVNEVHDELRNLILTLCSSCVRILAEPSDQQIDSPLRRWVASRLGNLLIQHRRDIGKFHELLRTQVFSDTLGSPEISSIMKHFVSLTS